MSKNIYDMLNDNNINLEELEKENFTDIEIHKIKNNFKKSINKTSSKKKKSIIAAAILGGLIIGTLGVNSGNSVIASIKIIGSDISSALGIEKDLELYKTVVDKTITNDGISIKLNEVILDDDELIVSSTIRLDKEMEDPFSIHAFGDIYVNGREVSTGAAGSGKEIDKSTFEKILTYNLGGIRGKDLSGDLDIKIVYSDLYIGDEKIKTKPFIFEFTASGDELAIDTFEIPVNYTFTLENDEEIKLDTFKSNAIGQKINYVVTKKGNDKASYNMELRGYDDKGNKVVLYLSNGSIESGLFKNDRTVFGVSEDSKTLTLAPYAVAYPKEGGRMDNNFVKVGEEFTIEIK